MFRYACLFVAILTITVEGHFSAEEREALLTNIRPAIQKCMEEFKLKREDLTKEKRGNVDPCFLACCYKANNLIDEKGMFNPEQGIKTAKLFVKSDATMEKIKQVTETCTSVNDEKVTDGEKGCERAKLLEECFKKQHSQ